LAGHAAQGWQRLRVMRVAADGSGHENAGVEEDLHPAFHALSARSLRTLSMASAHAVVAVPVLQPW
jgi:hypothetical protein